MTRFVSQHSLEIKHLKRLGLHYVEPFILAAGECIAVIGVSGAGKSLLLRAIADLDPNEGDIRLDGQHRAAIPAPQWRRQVAYLPAESGWWADTVGEHFPGPGQGLRGFLETVALSDDCLSWQVSRLSSGEKQRLALVRLLLNKPKVLLLDEPTAALDATSEHAVEQLLKAQLADGVAILFVTHDLQQAKRLAKRRLRVDHGRVREESGLW